MLLSILDPSPSFISYYLPDISIGSFISSHFTYPKLTLSFCSNWNIVEHVSVYSVLILLGNWICISGVILDSLLWVPLYSVVSATQLLLVLCLMHTCFVWPPRANQDQWVEVAGKPILPPYKEELLNTLSCLNGMGCFQKSWVLCTEGIWTEATYLLGMLKGLFWHQVVFLQDDFCTPY